KYWMGWFLMEDSFGFFERPLTPALSPSGGEGAGFSFYASQSSQNIHIGTPSRHPGGESSTSAHASGCAGARGE
ncbi:MAG: hypothetical protein LUE17_11740, partial [Planctomycetaceae bacterium]|nr:hypothetical protein [Planctomycetaceae bacterium]